MCNGCDEIINVGSQGFNGWTPVLGLYEGTCDGDPVTVLQIISFTGGSGTKPDYLGNIMTDQWLIDHPIYLGSAGLVTDICEAVNLQPSNGTNGTNGTNGEQGPPGEDGCTPEISFTANVGEERPIECTVEGVIDGCTSSWNINFPEEIFTSTTVVDAVTGSETFTTAVENAIDSVLNVTPISVPVTISTSNTGSNLLWVDDRAAIEGILIPNITISTLASSWFYYYIIGNQMTIHFRFLLHADAPGLIRLHVRIPASKTYALATGTPIMISRGSIINEATPMISGAGSLQGNSWLRINDRYDNGTTGFPIANIAGGYNIFSGQYTFLIN